MMLDWRFVWILGGVIRTWIQTVLLKEAVEFRNTMVKGDSELGIWLEVACLMCLILFSKNKRFIL
jgi:uncharacterized membrane protein YhdT